MGRDGESKILFPTMKSLDADKKAGKSTNSTSEAAPEKEEVIDFSKVKVEPKNLLISILSASQISEL